MDFLSDPRFDGRRIRILTIVDAFSRLSPATDVRPRYRGSDGVETLERVPRVHGLPKTIRVDNGPEFVSRDLDLWAWMNGVSLDFSRSGEPTDNVFIESFNGSLRAGCLVAFAVSSAGLEHAQRQRFGLQGRKIQTSRRLVDIQANHIPSRIEIDVQPV